MKLEIMTDIKKHGKYVTTKYINFERLYVTRIKGILYRHTFDKNDYWRTNWSEDED